MHANVIGSVCCVLLTTLTLEPLQPVQIPGPEADIDWQFWSFVITAAYVTVTVSDCVNCDTYTVFDDFDVADSDWQWLTAGSLV